jgi:acetyl-CoA acetyltransferase
LGLTEVGKVYDRTAADFAAQAVINAVTDAGLQLSDVDGMLVSSGVMPGTTMSLSRELGMRNLRLLTEMNCHGAGAIAMVTHAALAVASGMADTVACVWSDAPLTRGRRVGAAYSVPRSDSLESEGGMESVPVAAGLVGATPYYALAARRHMARYGTTSEQLGAIAVQTRDWATMNPLAQMRQPITLADHQTSRMIADPLHLLDCCLVSNGGAAVLVTSTERGRSLRQPPVHVLGFGQGHPGYPMEADSDFGSTSGAKISGETAMKMAGIAPRDIDICELYDCYTFTTLISLEDYGFCDKGEGGPFAESGALGPSGSLPTNTGGGQLSGYYLWGMTPLSEAIVQARGQAEERQVNHHDVLLVSGNGGRLDHHSTLVLSPHEVTE